MAPEGAETVTVTGRAGALEVCFFDAIFDAI